LSSAFDKKQNPNVDINQRWDELQFGGAAGEPPPGSEKPDCRFLQAQHRFYLERVSFSVQESNAPEFRLSFGCISEHLSILVGLCDRRQGGSDYPLRTVVV